MQRVPLLSFVAVMALAASGCSGTVDDDPEIGSGGTAGSAATSGGTVNNASGGASPSGLGGSSSGGVSAAGGASNGGASAGAPATFGGAVGAGGTATAAGGSALSGGSTGRGGASASGGRRGNNGGSTGTGGVTTTNGGSSSGGSTSTSGGSASGGGTSTAGQCSLMQSGATGDEPNGQIPVCCAPTSAENALIQEVFTLLNAHRAANGLSALAYDTKLEAAVQGHCLHMGLHEFFAHEAPEAALTTPWTRATLCGSSANGENIAQGQRSPADVMTAWTNSSGHNANMLNTRFKRVGIGYDASSRSWGQLFGN